MTGTFTKRLRATRALWANPVVTRDLRVRMRGSKSYWHQGFYLGLLGVLALAGYGTAVGWGGEGDPNGMSAVDVQQHLQSFYYFIFFTLAALITLIAPALTAVSITTERQRLSLDLLVTTPLTASELLIGKMLSSTAFLALLLALSLPASALCVILGGATLGDVIRVYLLLAVDGLVLAALGLLVSCATRASLPALVWTYLTVAGFLALTAFAYFATLASTYGRSAGTTASPAASVGALNPFVAVYIGGQSFDVGNVHVPLWVGAGVVAVLLIRLLVTAATYRLGSYGGSPIGSLRRQLLLLSGVGVFGLAYGIFQGALLSSGVSGSQRGIALEGGLLFVFALAGLLLPSLFTPATPSEDDPPGVAVEGWYAPLRAFRPEHAGALPFFHLWLVTIVLAAMAGLWAVGALTMELWQPALLTAFYLSGVGFLFWALCRRASSWLRGVTAGRALGFVLFAVLAWLPLAILMLFSATSSDLQIKDSPLSWFWIFYPLLRMETTSWHDGTAITALVWSGALCYGLGLLIYPFWRSVVPGGRAKAEKHNANAVQS
ncbi:MAG: ABC transporter permease subunit [Armatimonadota bacterium]|nr:ABC transporter permease subunit [Armatimonadota bacterium]